MPRRRTELALRARAIKAGLSPGIRVMTAFATALMMWYGARMILVEQALEPGTLVLFLAYLSKLYAPIRGLSKLPDTFSKPAIAFERIQVMLQVQNLFALAVAAWMLSHHPTLMMNLDSRWQNTHSRLLTCSQRRRVEVGSRLHAALFVHLSEILFRQFEVLALQRHQVWLFKFEHLSSGLLAFADYAREIFPAAFQQRFI